MKPVIKRLKHETSLEQTKVSPGQTAATHFRLEQIDRSEQRNVEERVCEMDVDCKARAFEEYRLVDILCQHYTARQSRLVGNTKMMAVVERLVMLKWFKYGPSKAIKKIIKDLETTLNEDLFIQELAKFSMVRRGYVLIDLQGLCAHKKALKLIMEADAEIARENTKWLNAQDPNALTRSWYTNNVHMILEMLGITDKAVVEAVEYAALHRIAIFSQYAPYPEVLSKYQIIFTNALFQSEEYNNIVNILLTSKEYHNPNTLCHYFFDACKMRYKNKKDVTRQLIPIATPSSLTPANFAHIPQYAYLEGILRNAIANQTPGINILLYGKSGTGKTQLAKTLMAQTSDMQYAVTEKGAFAAADEVNSSKGDAVCSARTTTVFILNRLLRTAKNATLLCDEAEDIFRTPNTQRHSKLVINELLTANTTPVFWTTNAIDCIENSFLRRFTYTLCIDELPLATYQKIIQDCANKSSITLEDKVIKAFDIARLSLGNAERVLNSFVLSGSTDQENIVSDIIDTVAVSGGNTIELKKLSNKIDSTVFNPELVNASDDLIAITDGIMKTGRRDFNMVLYGAPGSSKTSFGKHLAEKLKSPVICTSYTELSSCWVGETEKRIRNLFEEARAKKAVLILDECDVLLADRTRAGQSWEVSQTEALLTCMDEHDQPFIMTTNLFDNLDSAVMRRVLFKIKCDYLTRNQVRMAFNHFFNIELSDSKCAIPRLTCGDFAIVKKRAEYSGKLRATEWLINQLTEEAQLKIRKASTPIGF